MRFSLQILRFAIAATLPITALSAAHVANAEPIKNVVLVHGFFADGSGWQPVATILIKKGYKVAVVQEPETSFEDDVKATTRVIEAQDGPVILVGHSYGGAVITEAGNNDKVAGLVYVAAFQPDTGESSLDLTKKIPAPSKAIKTTKDDHLYLDESLFHADFAADVPAAQAKFMAISQVTPAAKCLSAPISKAAWRSKPSWSLIATADRAINPDLERFMSKRAGSKTAEVHSSHVAYISHPDAVAKMIDQAATGSGKSR